MDKIVIFRSKIDRRDYFRSRKNMAGLETGAEKTLSDTMYRGTKDHAM